MTITVLCAVAAIPAVLTIGLVRCRRALQPTNGDGNGCGDGSGNGCGDGDGDGNGDGRGDGDGSGFGDGDGRGDGW